MSVQRTETRARTETLARVNSQHPVFREQSAAAHSQKRIFKLDIEVMQRGLHWGHESELVHEGAFHFIAADHDPLRAP
jgi:hypothetical protein